MNCLWRAPVGSGEQRSFLSTLDIMGRVTDDRDARGFWDHYKLDSAHWGKADQRQETLLALDRLLLRVGLKHLVVVGNPHRRHSHSKSQNSLPFLEVRP